MENSSANFVIAIGRQFGSGGREIGRLVAQRLGIAYYDKEILSLAAEESGFNPELFERNDERKGFFRSMLGTITPIISGNGDFYASSVSDENLFRIQSDAIRKASKRGSCLFIGRCADYILRDDPACVSFFIHNSWANRIERVTRQLGVSVEEAQELMTKKDKSRAAYYNYYTNKTWGMAESYHFSIDVSVLGIDETVNMLRMLVEKRQAVRPPHFG